VTRTGETHLVLETPQPARTQGAATSSYSIEDVGARLASGSFPTQAMVVRAPCSIRTMSAIASGISSICCSARPTSPSGAAPADPHGPRDPLHLGLSVPGSLDEMGAIIASPIPGFYHQPQSVLELVDTAWTGAGPARPGRPRMPARWDPAPDPPKEFE